MKFLFLTSFYLATLGFSVENAQSADAFLSLCWSSLISRSLVPDKFLTHPDLQELAWDPATKKTSEGNLWEAFAILQAIDCGYIIGPASRGSALVDFFDGTGSPIDVKAPVTHLPSNKWKLDIPKATQSIIDKLRKTHVTKWRQNPEPIVIILDLTRMSPIHAHALKTSLYPRISKAERERLIELSLGNCL